MLFIRPVLLSVLSLLLVTGCGNTDSKGAGQTNEIAAGDVPFQISGIIKNPAADSVRLYEFGGQQQKTLGTAAIAEDGSFSFSGKIPQAGIYLLGTSTQKLVEVVLKEDAEVTVAYDEADIFNSVEFTNSEVNTLYRKFMLNQQQYQQQIQQKTGKFRQYMMGQQQAEAQAIKQEIDSLNNLLYTAQQEMRNADPLLEKIINVYQFKPYNAATDTDYATEAEYFKGEFLAGIDFNDPTYGYLPIFYNKVSQYAQALLMNFGLGYKEFNKVVDPLLAKTRKGNKTHRMMLLALINGAANAQQNPAHKDIYLQYAEKFVGTYPNETLARQLQGDIDRLGATRVGGKAPNITMANPQGQNLSLEDLRGKVVLLDFWASWCRPCRMENPNVVRVYNKYKDKGFTVFSVSLDKNKQRWLQAIEQDGLVWPNHVSDLQGWQNSAAKKYGVTGIPFALLLDQEGNIVAKNLRGAALEREVKQLLESE